MDVATLADDALFVGLMSGTSADAVDAVLCRFADDGVQTLATHTHPWPDNLREQALRLGQGQQAVELDALGQLDVAIGRLFADAVHTLLEQAAMPARQVRAIGSHGQTLRHRPDGPLPFTLQIGDASVIAERTGIDTVADFRRADVAAGGQGAPLMPAFHDHLLRRKEQACGVLNLGGIANLTVLRPGAAPIGFDVGPANGLMDAWCHLHTGQPFDRDGAWGASGRADAHLLQALLDEPYFQRGPPKSTGREYFNLDWVRQRADIDTLSPADVQATLAALTVATVQRAVDTHAGDIDALWVCGGGSHHPGLMRGLADALAPRRVDSTAALGIDPDYLEATGFAWLAQRRLRGEAIDLRSITGARGPRLLGAVYEAPRR